MKTPSTTKARNELIAMLRMAVRAQIEFWDFALEVAEIIDVDLSLVMEFCQAAAISADTGLELGETDLLDLLDSVARTHLSELRPGGPFRIT
jgi:hypothetical protein